AASAAAVANLSRTTVDFNEVPAIAAHVQPVFVTNVGDAPLNISAVALTGANAPDFLLGGTCVAQTTLAPGGRCRIDITTRLGFTGGTARAATIVIGSDASPSAPSINVS